MAYCVNHPLVETHAACANCGQPFCDSCLVEFLGQRYCGPCRDIRLSEMQGPSGLNAPFAGTGTVDMGRWISAGWQLIQADLGAWVVATLLLLLIGTASCGICLGALYAGMYMMAFRKMTTGTVAIENVFDGFRRFLWSFLAMLLLGTVSTVVYFLLQAPNLIASIVAPSDFGLQLLLTAVYYLTLIPVSALLGGATLFVLPHIAARNVNPIDAIVASWTVFRRNVLMFALTALVFQIIQVGGFYVCCVPGLFTWPLIVAATAQAYVDHFGIDVPFAP